MYFKQCRLIKNYIQIILYSSLLAACTTFQQVPIPGVLDNWPHGLPPPLITDPDEKKAMIQETIRFLEENNNSYWGLLSGDDRSAYLRLYDELSSEIERSCVSFINLDLDWLTLKKEIGDDIASADSHGAALGALSRLTYYLKEGHTMIIPERLVMNNNLKSGALCISLSGFNINPLGTWITPCKDNRLVVSRVFDNSPPYSWEAGDEIIALNGIPWQEWRQPLEQSSLPIIGSAGANATAVNLNWQKSIMRNIHLFSTVTIRRKASGTIDSVKIPDREFTAGEQYREAPFPIIFVPGSEIGKNYDALDGGILPEKNIGYIRVNYFDQEIKDLKSWDPSRTRFYKEFRDAVASLLDTEGIILDFRNHGGGMHQVSYGGLELLVKNPDDMQFYDVFEKTGPDTYSRYLLLTHKFQGQNPDTVFGKKVVVLTGSECVSGGDFFTAIASGFEEITVMGTANNGSFSGHMDDKVYREGDIKIFAVLPSIIWYRHNTKNSDLRKSFVEKYIEYNADDITRGKDTLLQAAVDFIRR